MPNTGDDNAEGQTTQNVAPLGNLLKWHFPRQQPGCATASNTPLVVLLGWMFASNDALQQYVALVNSLGWACCVYRPKVLPLWIPAWSSATAHALLSELEAELAAHGPRPVVFGVFSGAAKAVYYHMLAKLGPIEPVPDLDCSTKLDSLQASGRSEDPAAPPSLAYTDPKSPALPHPAMVAALRAAIPQPWEHAEASLQGPPEGTEVVEASVDSRPRGLAGRVQASLSWVFGARSGRAGAGQGAVGTGSKQSGVVVGCQTSPFRLVSACVCGQWFDSAPVDFTGAAGARMVVALQRARQQDGKKGESARSVPLQLLEAGVGVLSGAMEYMGLEAFEAQRQAMWGTLAGSDAALQGPSLFCYSWDDNVADPVRIQRLAAALRARGAVVLEQTWPQSQHVGHARKHADSYREVLSGMLSTAQAAFDATQQERARRIKASMASEGKGGDSGALQMASAAAGAAVAAAAVVVGIRSKL